MYRVFLDANVLWSASYNIASRLARLWALPDVRLISSTYAIMEVVRNVSGEEQLRDLQRLLQFVDVVPPPTSDFPENVWLHPKDQPILMAAIDGGATHLITGDSDFGELFGHSVRGVPILRPRDFLALAESR